MAGVGFEEDDDFSGGLGMTTLVEEPPSLPVAVFYGLNVRFFK